MLVRLIQKIRRSRTSKPVTQGWVKYRDLMMTAEQAAESNYILTLVKNTPDREYAWCELQGYLDDRRTAAEVIQQLMAEGATT